MMNIDEKEEKAILKNVLEKLNKDNRFIEIFNKNCNESLNLAYSFSLAYLNSLSELEDSTIDLEERTKKTLNNIGEYLTILIFVNNILDSNTLISKKSKIMDKLIDALPLFMK